MGVEKKCQQYVVLKKLFIKLIEVCFIAISNRQKHIKIANQVLVAV